jgi:hypothetical protein
VEATTWEPFGDVTEEGKEVDEEETGREEDVELVGCVVGNANQWVVLVFRSVSVRYPEDNDTDRPIMPSINQSAPSDYPLGTQDVLADGTNKVFGFVQYAAEHQCGLLFQGVPELLDASPGTNDTLKHAPARLELIIVFEEDKDVLPTNKVAGHREMGPARVDGALFAENFGGKLR